jgi:hypothetical protein
VADILGQGRRNDGIELRFGEVVVKVEHGLTSGVPIV